MPNDMPQRLTIPFKPLLAILLGLFMFALAARADAPVYQVTDGAAVSGYDTVAYFVKGQAIPGRPDIEVEWKGAVWRFASLENRRRFEANPRAYAPQYGGYCAYALSKGHLANTDPRAWKIVNGRLYLVHSLALFKVWLRDIPGNLALSDANWPDALSR